MNFLKEEVDLEYQRLVGFFLPQRYYSSSTLPKEEAKLSIKYVQDLSDVIHGNYNRNLTSVMVLQVDGSYMAPCATEKLHIKVRSKSSK